MCASRLVLRQKKKPLPMPKIIVPAGLRDEINLLIPKLKDLKTFGKALSALKKIGVPAIPALSKFLEKAPGLRAGLRAAVVETLGNIGDPRATPALVRALKDKNPSVRSFSAISIGKIADKKTTSAMKQRATPALIRALKDKDKTVRNDAAEALGDLKDTRAVKSLINIFGNPLEHRDVRKTAAQSLGKIGDPRAITDLEGVRAIDPNIEIQDAATGALNKIKLKSSIARRRP